MRQSLFSRSFKGAWLALLLCCAPLTAFAQTPAPQPQQTPAPAQSDAAPTPSVPSTPPDAKPAQPPAAAPTPSPPEAAAARDLDAADTVLKKLDASLQNHDVSDADLQAMRDKGLALVAQLQTVLEHLETQLAAVKARLDQLGPAPDAKAPREAPEVTKERLQQTQEYETVDALVKRTKLLIVQAQQLAGKATARQRAKFTHSLFERDNSILNPEFWADVAAKTPHNFKLARESLGDWVATIDKKLTTGPAILFWLSVLVLILIYRPLAIVSRHLLLRQSDSAQPSRFRKIVVAWWVTIIIAGFPMLALLALAGILHIFNLFDAHRQAAFYVIARSVAYVAVAVGLASGLLAPAHENWRLVEMSSQSCRHALRAILIVASLLALSHFLVTRGATIGVDQTYQAALRGLTALLVALTIIIAMWRAGVDVAECDTADIFGPKIPTGRRDWYGILRFLLWIAAIAILVSLALGYLRFGAFLAEQINWAGEIFFVAIMANILSEESLSAGCRAETPFGHALTASLGLGPGSIEQLAVLLRGGVSVAIFIAAVLAILAPWGVQSGDLPSYLRAALFGFRVGDITVSFSSIVIALAILFAGVMATRIVERWLDKQFLPRTHLNSGIANAIKTSFGYTGFLIAIGFALAYLGLNFERLAIVAGALSVGIGFGLQSIVNNFVSGLIILWEQTIRVGDWIVVGGDEGVVNRINVRATEISTFDRAAVVIPNANLVAGVVKNYVRTDRTGRIVISVPVNAAANPETARDLLLAIANDNQDVLETPAPFVLFTSITSAAFNFELYCYVPDIGNAGTVKTALNFEIYRRFKAAELFSAPPPESVVRVTGLEALDGVLGKPSSNGLGKTQESG